MSTAQRSSSAPDYPTKPKRAAFSASGLTDIDRRHRGMNFCQRVPRYGPRVEPRARASLRMRESRRLPCPASHKRRGPISGDTKRRPSGRPLRLNHFTHTFECVKGWQPTHRPPTGRPVEALMANRPGKLIADFQFRPIVDKDGQVVLHDIYVSYGRGPFKGIA